MRSLIWLWAVALVVGACAGTDSVEETTTAPLDVSSLVVTTTTETMPAPTSEGPAASLVWNGANGTLTVPLDHEDPDGATIDVPLARREADDPENRIGVLLGNPGGPGDPALWTIEAAPYYLSDVILARFDIIALGPRGTFPDTQIDCFGDFAGIITGVDWSPDAPGEQGELIEHQQRLIDECEQMNGDMLEHVSTMDTVHDMAILVTALGEDQITYFGSSYGSQLGAAFATEYPELVRAAVFDGDFFLDTNPVELAIGAVTGRETRLVALIDECDATPTCLLHGRTKEAFTNVAAAVDAEPIPASPALPGVNEEALIYATFYTDSAYAGDSTAIIRAVAAFEQGDPTELQQQFRDAVTFQGEGVAALQAISCVDHPIRGPVDWPDDGNDVVRAAAPTYTEVFPRPPEEFWDNTFQLCNDWPAGPDPILSPLSAESSGPILLVATTGDVVTPVYLTERLAAQMTTETVLYVESDQHDSYSRDAREPARQCATTAIDDFLVDLALPDTSTCPRNG